MTRDEVLKLSGRELDSAVEALRFPGQWRAEGGWLTIPTDPGRRIRPLPYSSRWEHAGPLLEESLIGILWSDSAGWACVMGFELAHGSTPCEAIARCWLLWKGTHA